MDAFTHELLERGNLSEIECWHEIAHEACQHTWTGMPNHVYWFWSNLYWDTIETVRAIRHPTNFEPSQDLNINELTSTLGQLGFNVVIFE